MPARPRIKPPVGKSGPGTISRILAIGVCGSSISAMVASMISLRLCGGMLVAMPTAMPDEPLIKQVRNARRQDFRLLFAVVVVRRGNRPSLCRCLPAACRRCATGAPRCTASPPADRRPPNRSCPAHPSAGSAWKTAAPCGPTHRTPACRRAGDTYPGLRRRSWRTFESGRLKCRPISCKP